MSAMVTRTYSTSFSLAVRMLPSEQRLAIYSIYGFVRFADEIVDTFLESNQKQLLDDFENDLMHAFDQGISLNPILHAFVNTVNKYNIPRRHIDAFMKSMQTDLYKHEYKSDAETMDYIHGSAEVVGLMCLKIFVNGSDSHYTELENPAMKLGSAFQKVNFLRDLKADTEILHRTYFPGLQSDGLHDDLKTKLIAEVEEEFREARKGISKLPGRSRLAVLVAYLYYTRLLEKLKKTPAEKIMNQRIRVNNARKLTLLFNAMIIYKFRLN
jgi:phytoene/squalene synthetase